MNKEYIERLQNLVQALEDRVGGQLDDVDMVLLRSQIKFLAGYVDALNFPSERAE